MYQPAGKVPDVSYAYRCETCNALPWWRVERVGDAVVSWACRVHLGEVCWGLQRPFHRTELVVKHNWGGVDINTAPSLDLEPRDPGRVQGAGHPAP